MGQATWSGVADSSCADSGISVPSQRVPAPPNTRKTTVGDSDIHCTGKVYLGLEERFTAWLVYQPAALEHENLPAFLPQSRNERQSRNACANDANIRRKRNVGGALKIDKHVWRVFVGYRPCGSGLHKVSTR